MSSSTPRKFSEKIAILNRKAQEDQSEFEKVMHDVKMVRNQEPHPSTSRNDGMGPHQPGWPRPGSSGSLPNVPRMINYPDMNPQFPWAMPPPWGPPMVDTGPPRVIHPSRERSPGSQHGAHPYHHPYRPVSPHSVSPHRPRSSERTQASHHPAAPNLIPVGPHLDIPQNQDWRRTHSDPSIHHSAVSPAGQPLTPPMNPNTPPQLRSSPTDESSNTDNTQGPSIYLEPKERGMGRPSSCEGGGGNGGPGGGGGGGQTGLPVPPHGYATGSLPDLPSSLPGHGYVLQPPAYPQLPPDPHNCSNSSPSHLQQRHSIQLPVNSQFGQIQHQQQPSPHSPAGSIPYSNYSPNSNFTLDAGFNVSSQSQSAPNSPASPGGQGDSPVPSPGTQAYNAVHAGLNSLSFQAPQEEMSGGSGVVGGGGGWIHPQHHQQVYTNPTFSPNQYIPASDAYGLIPPGGPNIPEINVIGPTGMSMPGVPTVADLGLSFQMTPDEIQSLLVSDQVDESSENALRHETS